MNPVIIPEKDHKKRHQLLYNHLNELVADFITHTGKLPSKVTLFEFMDWSAQQVRHPEMLQKQYTVRPNINYNAKLHTRHVENKQDRLGK